jgi:hypothetical protein
MLKFHNQSVKYVPTCTGGNYIEKKDTGSTGLLETKEEKRLSLDYIAGFFDGEGSVTLGIYRSPKTKYGFGFFTRISISQKQPEVLFLIKQSLGFGEVETFKEYSNYRIRKKPDVLRFIDLMQPKVNIKKAQLMLLKEAIVILYKQIEKGKCPRTPYTKEETLQLLEIANKLRALNRKGPNSTNLEQAKAAITVFNEEQYRQRISEVEKRNLQNLWWNKPGAVNPRKKADAGL